eukprot:GDKJ01024102.1.p2 GENE.GDKJ01024102.1~~GDKJ01024102.1.p2  ORF type:complete len:133 (-),score=37.48 GDKJ01024102.1:71-469(-)
MGKANCEMSFSRFVEAGRVVRVTYGADADKAAVIADILDQNRVLIDGPHIERQLINTKRIALTDIVLPIQRGARSATVKKAYAVEDIDGKLAATATGKKLAARVVKANLSDFDRFKLMVAKKHRAALIAKKN